MNDVALEQVWAVTAGLAGAAIRLVVRHDLKLLPAFFVLTCGAFFGLFVAPYVNDFMPHSSRRSLVFVAMTLGFIGLTVGEVLLKWIDNNGDGIFSSLSDRWFPHTSDKKDKENEATSPEGAEPSEEETSL